MHFGGVRQVLGRNERARIVNGRDEHSCHHLLTWHDGRIIEIMKYTIRPCRTLNELSACVRLQKKVWGYADHEVYPLRLFVSIGKIGGYVLGAFAERTELVGFLAFLPAWRGKLSYYHSLSLGVLPGHENQGLGRRLKLAQRKLALARRIKLIEWTFDPLRAKNAYFNIVRLGAIARKYQVDHYGPVESRLQQCLPSDRLVAEWWLASPRVKRALVQKNPRSEGTGGAVQVAIPRDIELLIQDDPALARKQQLVVRRQFQKYFARKLAITGLVYKGDKALYLLDAYEN